MVLSRDWYPCRACLCRGLVNLWEQCDPVDRESSHTEWILARGWRTVLGTVLSTTHHYFLQLNQPILTQQELSIFSFLSKSFLTTTIFPSSIQLFFSYSFQTFPTTILLNSSNPSKPVLFVVLPSTYGTSLYYLNTRWPSQGYQLYTEQFMFIQEAQEKLVFYVLTAPWSSSCTPPSP